MEEKRCCRCGHTCVAAVTGKVSDLFGFRWPGGREHVGYVLPHMLIGLREEGASNDYMNFSYCLVCGQIQGEWPVKAAQKYLKEHAKPKYYGVVLTLDTDENKVLIYKSHSSHWVLSEIEKRDDVKAFSMMDRSEDLKDLEGEEIDVIEL